MLEIAPDKPVIPPGLESMVENANKRYLEEGGKGTVISKPEEVFALLYQNGFDEAIANYCSYKDDFAKYRLIMQQEYGWETDARMQGLSNAISKIDTITANSGPARAGDAVRAYIKKNSGTFKRLALSYPDVHGYLEE